jgi:hypothetical protein
MKKRMACFLTMTLLFGSISALADWEPGDGHKMHWPQTPKPGGFDVSFQNRSLADDWLCTETGPVSNIHFWISWYNNWEVPIWYIDVRIWSDCPVGAPCNQYGYSVPRDLLWERRYDIEEVARAVQPPDLQGWFDPAGGVWQLRNHDLWEQINIVDIEDPFIQEVDSIYWLEIYIFAPDASTVGWKETDQNWNDDAVHWVPDSWIELRSPLVTEFIRGDLDGDGDVDISDFAICQGGPGSCADAWDVDDDGTFDAVVDCQYLFDFVIGGPSPPAAPFPDCGPDPTADTLVCEDHYCQPLHPSTDLAFVINGPAEGSFIRGDANADMGILMDDAIFTLKALYVPGAPQPSCMDAGDTDDNGTMEMSDAIYTLKHLYVPGSPAPLPPFPGCGVDPTDDQLDCVDHPCMGGM